MNARAAFVDFLLGLLQFDPATRWTPEQVRNAPPRDGFYGA